MALFNKNPNEAAYPGGKKHYADVIKNSGFGEALIWRQPEEDFNTNSTLVVMPGEEAIFIKSGTIERVFENGTYKLSTENYPFISRLRNTFTGGVSTFNCVVYFIRKAHSEEILWGTNSPIQVRDKFLGIATKIRGRGSYKVQIENPAIFLEKLIGNNVPVQFQQELNKYFISEFQSKIKSIIAKVLNESETEILGIDAKLDEFSEIIEPFMQEVLFDYGLRCVKFTVSALDIDDDELRRKYDEIGMDNVAKLRGAQADKAVMGVLGDDWNRQQVMNILDNLSTNSESGSIASIGAGIGAGIGAAGAFDTLARQLVTSETAQQVSSSPGNSAVETLKELKQMLDEGLIEQTEYDAKKAEILSRM